MTQGVVVGIDGTKQAEAAAAWAADEAVLRGTGLRLVHAREPWPESDEPWAEQLLARTADGLRARHPGLSVTVGLIPSGPVPGLVAAAEEGTLLVLGSRALGSVAGYLMGSVGLSVAGVVERPVVLVRDHGDVSPRGSVTVGVDAQQPEDAALQFAFEEAERRLGSVHVVYAQQLPSYGTLGPAMVSDVRLAVAPEIERSLDDLLEPWRTKHPDVTATARVTIGSAGLELVRASGDSALMVVGRRTRRSVLGARLGSVAHAVLHHSRAPVAVVPHD
ncbi:MULTISPECIES: universal stress protein [Streptomyces]|uniref:Nucleotide-binding universal stress UspA family protein n=1 Tax=Streptomyces nymphaeiformis TaxID=2663842 RepID=A0A7W7U2M7_9ACTN|nr:universal stress protein [Streptomyces nymphaeiformis]MBB4983920.1 nucleotide-binding universal stress UspA family protein [Streptomyces nymphaeiformis]